MARYCADCVFLKVDDKGNGKYKCSKIDKEVFANMPCCDKFEFSYKNRADRDSLYDMGKELENKASTSNLSTGTLLVIAIILALLLVICSIFM